MACSPLNRMLHAQHTMCRHTHALCHGCAEFDEECRAMVAENLQRKVACHPGTNPVSIEKLPSGELKLTYKGSGAEETIVVDQVMMATGRTPNTQHLGLEV